MDAELHLWSVLFRSNSSIFSTNDANTWLFHLSDHLTSYWDIIERFLAGTILLNEANDAITSWREDVFIDIQAYPPDAEERLISYMSTQTETREFRQPFVSVHYFV